MPSICKNMCANLQEGSTYCTLHLAIQTVSSRLQADDGRSQCSLDTVASTVTESTHNHSHQLVVQNKLGTFEVCVTASELAFFALLTSRPCDNAFHGHDSQAQLCIPQRSLTENKNKRPWLNDACRQAIRNKNQHEGTDRCMHFRDVSSHILSTEYVKCVKRTRDAMKKLPRGSKKWWTLNSMVSHRRVKQSSIPSLKYHDQWLHNAVDKANYCAVCSSESSIYGLQQ